LKSWLILCTICIATFKLGNAEVFNVRQYGAKGNGITNDYAAITLAIQACAKAGGGTVYFSSGKYLTGNFNLTSNLLLLLDNDATILGSQEQSDYPLIAELPSYASSGERVSPLVSAYGESNITIQGGTINGQGQVWWDRFKNNTLPHGRPHLVELNHVDHLVIKDITLTMSGSWTLHPIYCNDVTISNVTILNPLGSPNTDGIDPDSSTNVLITNCYIDTWDDCIAVKSGKNEAGIKYAKPSENIVVQDCVMLSGVGISVGSETSGSVRNVTFRNIVLKSTEHGPYIKSAPGRGGVVEDILYENITFTGTRRQGIEVTMNYTMEPGPLPAFRRFTLRNVHGLGGSPSAGTFDCYPDSPCTEVTLDDVSVIATEGWKCKNVSGKTSKVSPQICF